MNIPRYKIIACRTVIEEMRPLMSFPVECLSLDSGLHLDPEKMREALQGVIDEITMEADYIILAYGLCSLGVIGLKASHSTLVIPRLDDCIAIFLGSRDAYENILDEEPGTYFLSRGWIEAGITLLDELKSMEERYGRVLANRLLKVMLKNYRWLTYVETGGVAQEKYRRFARKAAGMLGLRYMEIKGSEEFIKKILYGPWDDDFIVAPPGYAVGLKDFGLSQYGMTHRNSLLKEDSI